MSRGRPTAKWIARALAFALAATPLLGACSDSTDGGSCYPGDWRYCDCAAGKRGYSQCDGRGQAYGACDCSGAVPAGAGILVEAGVAEAASEAEAGLLPFLAPCGDDSQCESHLCFAFNAFGPHCSHACTKDSDCQAPSPGCSNKGVCKLH